MLCCAWCHTEPVLAVSTNACQVNFYGDEGDRLQGSEFKRPVNATALDWRPKSQVCAVGWEDGCVSLWSTKSRVAKEDAQLHRDAKIVFVKWSPEGSRFVAGDDKGQTGTLYGIDGDDGIVQLTDDIKILVLNTLAEHVPL